MTDPGSRDGTTVGEDQVKASVLRGYVDAMADMKLTDEIRSRVPAETSELIASPPPATVWMPGVVIEHVADAVAAARGLPTVRACGRLASEYGTGKIARALTEGVLRLFSASPAAIFSRYTVMSSNFCRGMEFIWTPDGDNAGTMEMRIPSRPISMPSMVATAGGFEHVLRICHRKGEVAEPASVSVSRGGAARYRIQWER